MGDAAGELADALQPLGALEARLELLALALGLDALLETLERVALTLEAVALGHVAQREQEPCDVLVVEAVADRELDVALLAATCARRPGRSRPARRPRRRPGARRSARRRDG